MIKRIKEVLLIKEWIKVSAKFGYHIAKINGAYVCETRCECCGSRFVSFVKPVVIDGSIKCDLPFYCEDCKA